MTSLPGGEAVDEVELAIGLMVDDYRIEKVLGRGGMGFVYGVVNTVIGKRAAIKVLSSQLATAEMIERFFTEARAVNQIGHGNIVDIFGFGKLPDDTPYMVMEWLKGETLGDRMERPMSVAEICGFLEPIVSALEAAHAAGIVHRDLKPDNVFLVASSKGPPTVKLLDFGIAKLMGTDQQRVERTRTGLMIGTPAYMSPEQARGKDIDHRTDLYSLGVIAFELFCGRPPFTGETAMDLIVCHMQDPAPVPSSIEPMLTPAIDALVLALLEKNAASRPTLAQVASALEEIAAGNQQLAAIPARQRFIGTALLPVPTPRPGTLVATPAPIARTPTPAPIVSSSALGSPPIQTEAAPPRRASGRLIGAVATTVIVGVAVFVGVRAWSTSSAEQPVKASEPAPVAPAQSTAPHPPQVAPASRDVPPPSVPEPPSEHEPVKPREATTPAPTPAPPARPAIAPAPRPSPTKPTSVEKLKITADPQKPSLETKPDAPPPKPATGSAKRIDRGD